MTVTRRIFSKALAFAALAATISAGSNARAQQGGPTVVLTAKSAGEVIGDLRYLLSAVGKADDPQIQGAIAALDAFKDPAALQGLDPSKPLGMFGSLPDGPGVMPSAVIFVPVLDSKKLLDSLAGFGATVEADNTAPGFTHKVTAPGVPMPLYVTTGGGYLYVSLAPVGGEALKAMKPASLLSKRPGAGDLSLTVHLDRIPAALKEQFNAQFEQGLVAQRERKPNEPDNEYQGRMVGMKVSQDAIVALVRDGKELTLDFIIDQKTEFVGLELISGAVPGSEYAKALRKLGAMKSKFRGLSANAAVSGYAAVPVTQSVRDLMGKAFDQAMEKSAADNNPDEAAKKLIQEVAPAIRDTLTAESLDIAGALQGPVAGASDGAPTYAGVVAMTVKGGKKLDNVFRQFAKNLPADKQKDLKLDAAKAVDGTAIHKVTQTEGDAGPFGEKSGFFAFRDDMAAVGLGKNGLAALNSALAASKAAAPASGGSMGAVAPQVEILVSASRGAGLSDKKPDRDAMTAAAAEVFTGASAKKDKVSLVLRAQGDSMSLRIGGDVPALKFIVRAAQITRNGGANN